MLNEYNTGCSFCPNKSPIKHHTSYFPEVTIPVCRKCHGGMRNTHPELCPPIEDYHRFYGDKLYDSSKIIIPKEKEHLLLTKIMNNETIRLGEFFTDKQILRLNDMGALDDIKRQMIK